MSNLTIIGCDGLVGGALVAEAVRRGVNVTGTSRRGASGGVVKMDLAEQPVLPPELASGTVVLCAAVSTFADCVNNPEMARKVNVRAAEALAAQTAACGGHFISFSTSSVFDGTHPLPGEEEPVTPMTEYGRLKAEAEEKVRNASKTAAIVRPTKIVHAGLGMLNSWHRALVSGKPVEPASDLPCAPVSLEVLVEVIFHLIQTRAAGIWHVSAPDEVSYEQIARVMAEAWGADPGLIHGKRLEELGVRLEHAPRHAALGCARLNLDSGVYIPQSADTIRRTALEINRLTPASA